MRDTYYPCRPIISNSFANMHSNTTSLKRLRSATIPTKLLPTQSLLPSHITLPRPSTSTARSTSPLRRNASYPPCLLDSPSAISSSSPTMTPSRVCPGISLPQLSIRSKTSTVEHQMYSSSLSQIYPEMQKDTSRPSRSSRTVANASKPTTLNPSSTISPASTKLPNRPCLQPNAPSSRRSSPSEVHQQDMYT